NDVDALRAVLEEYQIETVLCALAIHIIGVGQSFLNLIQAADKTTYTKRFMTSTWAARASFSIHGFQYVESSAKLQDTRLEWTALNLGWLLDYYAMPRVDTYIPQTTFAVDKANKHPSVPGDGKQIMTFTYT
ncbi:hypothetical protein BKA59DRAFT_381748, partial [Fusarium tricinctum]